ncbi:MAG: hypothetical protein P9X26_08770 [Candidatus Stygibacter frigidus]|nr:hypothetical protein [Candidatus Stygibacter frigidus]
MRYKSIIFLSILILFLCSCAILNLDTNEQKQKLFSEKMLWQDFRIDGIIKLYIAEFNLIKDVTIIKDSTELKMTLYDTGLFGFSPQPFASLSVADSIKINIPSIEDPLQLAQIKTMIAGLTVFKSGFLNEPGIRDNLEEIIRTRRYETAEQTLKFNRNMQLEEIILKGNQIDVKIKREFSLHPQAIEIYYQNKLSIMIEIDKFICNEQE